MDEKLKAWTYSRIDAPEDTHGCIKEQKKELMDYAEQMGFEIVGSSQDVGSGPDFSRSGLREVKKAASDVKFGALLIKGLDRLGRDQIETAELLHGLNCLGIRLYSPQEGEIQLKKYSEIIHGIFMNME